MNLGNLIGSLILAVVVLALVLGCIVLVQTIAGRFA